MVKVAVLDIAAAGDTELVVDGDDFVVHALVGPFEIRQNISQGAEGASL